MTYTAESSTSLWLDWLGLPHVFGADPREGKGACCLVMARLLLTEAGEYFPPIEPYLLALAKAGQWDRLKREFHRHTVPLDGPEPWSLALIQNGPSGLGIGTVVPGNYLLIPHHRRGVRAVPLHLLNSLQFCRVRPLQ